MLKGRKTSGESWTLAAPVKPGGLTPTMVMGMRLSWMVLPMTEGERPKRRAQRPSLMTATGPEPGAASSDGWMARPRAG